jgi:hypothetical protein
LVIDKDAVEKRLAELCTELRAEMVQQCATQSANGIDSRTLVSGATEGCAAPRSAVGTGLIASTKDDYRTEPGVAVDDGSAAHEPQLIEKVIEVPPRIGWHWLRIDAAYPSDETTTASIDTSPDGVKAHIEQTIDHLQNHRVSPDQRRDLRKATEQAERTNNKSDAAIGNVIGRALR